MLSFEKLLGSDIDSWQCKCARESMGQWPTDDDVAKVTASASSTIAFQLGQPVVCSYKKAMQKSLSRLGPSAANSVHDAMVKLSTESALFLPTNQPLLHQSTLFPNHRNYRKHFLQHTNTPVIP